MTKNCIFFPLYIYNDWSYGYISTLYFALESLKKVRSSDSDYDVVVYCKYPDNFNNINEIFSEASRVKYNFEKDFPFVNFVNFDFSHNDSGTGSDKYFFKWKALDHFFANYNYNDVFVIDSDVLFFNDPISVFNSCSDKSSVYGLQEGSSQKTKDILTENLKGGDFGNHPNAWNGGQLYLTRSVYEKVAPMYNSMQFAKKDLLQTARKVYTDDSDYRFFDVLSDQYAMTLIFMRMSINRESIPDMLCGGGYNVSISKEPRGLIFYSNVSIIHYFTGRGYMFVPHQLRDTVEACPWLSQHRTEANLKNDYPRILVNNDNINKYKYSYFSSSLLLD